MEKILIIEDEKQLLQTLQLKIAKKGYSVLSANNGRDGLELAIKEKPDLILLDIIMPVMDGLTVLSELRKDNWGKSAKVIILTNLSDADSVAEALDKNAYDFLVKSDWKLEEVMKRVKEKLEGI